MRRSKNRWREKREHEVSPEVRKSESPKEKIGLVSCQLIFQIFPACRLSRFLETLKLT